MIGPAARDLHRSAGDGRGRSESAGFDSVCNYAVPAAVKRLDSLNPDGAGPLAFNLRSHAPEQTGKILDFRLARGIVQHRFAARQASRHQQILRPGDRHGVHENIGAMKALALASTYPCKTSQ